MKFSIVLFTILFFFSAEAKEKYSQIRIQIPDKAALDNIWATGIDYEGATGKIGGVMSFVAGTFELDQLRSRGISYEVAIDDISKHYEQQTSGAPVNALGFGFGSMGGHYTFQEMLQQLDSMRLLYPSLITVRDSIGRSQQGRAIWIAKIGSSQSNGKPEVLYTAIHHAREPAGMMSTIYYMWWLLENYTTNADAAYLVNNRRQWFIPVVNPDGYEYNRSTNPNGGGMWRKNRRANDDGSFGVDPNRNYGPMAMWNSSNGGSSTFPGSEVYRGPSPFSEPENQAIDNFMRTHNIKSCLNYHTYGSYLIYPWGYLSRENGDSLIYRNWAYDMTSANHFTSGTDQQTVNYSTRGNSDDYMFGDTTKPVTFTMTPEVGDETDGFWASPARILPLAVANLPMNKLLAYIAGQYPTVIQHSIQDAGGNGFLNRGENFSLKTVVKNKGLGTAPLVSIRAKSSLPTVQFSVIPGPIYTISPQQEIQVNLDGTVDSHATEGVPVQFYVTIMDGDGYQKIDTLNYFVGTPTVAFSDSANAGTTNWTTGSGWGTTTNAHTPPFAFTDSPSGNYVAYANNSLTLLNPISLNNYNYAQLKFWTKWAVEPTWDFATVEISTNNGASWTTLRSKLSHSGSARSGSMQPVGSWGFDGYTPGQTWVEQSVNLSNYVNKQIKLRFRMAADGGEQRDGVYVDDIRVHAYTTSVAPPDTGVVVSPASYLFNGVTGRVFRDSLTIRNFTDASISVSIADSSLTSSDNYFGGSSGKENNQSIIQKFKSALRNADFSRVSLRRDEVSPSNPEAYSTILTDERGENGFGSADIYSVLYQYRTAMLRSFHDFKIVLGSLPDTNVVVVLSIDTDQDFGTGRFPTPLGAGPTTRDIGSEFEVLLDASGILIDSLTPLGRTPAGIVVSTANDSISVVGFPFLLTVRKDSVLTISTESAFGGINATWLNDPDRRMNVGFVASHIQANANPLPDFAPAVGHANIGGETGASWLSQGKLNVTVAAHDSAKVGVAAVAAKLAGTYRANIFVNPAGRVRLDVPATMIVTTPSNPVMQLTPTIIRDTLALGDSVRNTISVRNLGGATLNFLILDTVQTPWLTVTPFAGSADSGVTVNVSLNVRSAGLRTDTTYMVSLLVVSNDPLHTRVIVTLTLRVKRLTAVNETSTVPATFALHENYPNPFNPSTRIAYDLPKSSFVTLKVYNLIGQEVATIVNEVQDSGFRSVTFSAQGGSASGGNSSSLASGVYFYRLVAGGFTQTKKMLLIR